ncbi:MAG: type IX secretion system protein PorQ [Cytophagales bacterium]|nr:type IX secretion system protein PorQ [Cytophagales bacterium]
MKKFLIILFVNPILLIGQSGGSTSFHALNLINNARTAALGGYNVSLADGDLAMISQNPALLDSVGSGSIVFMYNPFFADINALTFQYATEFGSLGSIGFGLTSVNYGEFAQTDETGEESGTFNARDYVFTIGKSHRLGPFVLGSNIKFIHSGIAGYTASAIALDFAGLYQLPNSDFSAGMVINNLGIVISDFTESSAELPLQVTAGISFKPEGMPIRFSLTGHNFTDAENKFFEKDENPNFADKILKRLSIGGELMFSRNVHFLFGYDHNRKRELTLEQTAGGAGFSYGLMIQMKKYRFRFSRATYHAAGGTSYISLQSNLKDIKKIF